MFDLDNTYCVNSSFFFFLSFSETSPVNVFDICILKRWPQSRTHQPLLGLHFSLVMGWLENDPLICHQTLWPLQVARQMRLPRSPLMCDSNHKCLPLCSHLVFLEGAEGGCGGNKPRLAISLKVLEHHFFIGQLCLFLDINTPLHLMPISSSLK